jgi:HlyD family secretion protein
MAKKKSNPTKRLLIIIGVLLVILFAGAIGGRSMGLFGGGGKGTIVETAKPEVRDVTQLVTASGKVQPETEVKISPDVSGEIIYLGVVEGQQVEKGLLLIRIRPDFYEAQYEKATAGVSQARAGLSRAKADLMKAELDMNRARELHERNVVAASEYEQAQMVIEIAKANHDAAGYQIAAAKAQQSEAAESLARTRIFSPMTGTVSMLNVELGERVVGTVQMAGTELLRIARLDHMEVEAEVNENDVVNITLGDTARIEVDAYPGQSFRGVVTEIANSARVAGWGTQEQVTNFPVKVRIVDDHNLDKAPGASTAVSADEVAYPTSEMAQFRPGMSSTVDLYTDFAGDCITVPIQAVSVRDFNKLDSDGDGNDDSENGESDQSGDDRDENRSGGVPEEEDLRKIVFAMVDGEAKMLEVETGIADATRIQITAGLEGDEEIITGPYSAVSRTLSEGRKVSTKDGKDRQGGKDGKDSRDS